MKIEVQYYRNVKKASLSIQEGKVNFLIGPCGSGKSSILDAISASPELIDTTVCHTPEETQVSIDGNSPCYSSIHKYCLDRQNALFDMSPNDDGYRVFIGDESRLAMFEASFDDKVSALKSLTDKMYVFRGRVDDLAKALGKPGAKGKYTPKSKFGKAYSALSDATPYIQSTLGMGGTKLLEWRVNGLDFVDLAEGADCPFCGQPIEAGICSNLGELRGSCLKEMKPFFSSTHIFRDLGIEPPDFSDDARMAKFSAQLEELFRARNEINKIIDFCNLSRTVSSLQSVPNGIEIDDIAYKYIDGLKPLVAEVNTQAEEISKLVGNMKAAFDALASTNAKGLNVQLRSLGIPYRFSVAEADRSSKKASYILKHVNSTNEIDMRKSLSYGERNLVALLLFLHNEEEGFILIDDPASSYDDFRRSQIYRCIMNQGDRTVLVVSHDHTFVRRAVSDSNPKIGSIMFMSSSSSGVKIQPVSRDSFVNLDDTITARIRNSSSYLQQIINVRLYYDIHRDKDRIAWEYTSAILHRTPKSEIEALLVERSSNEETVLSRLNKTIGTSIKESPEQYKFSIDESLTDFEVLIYAREDLKKEERKGCLSQEEKIQIKMLNDLVHMNDCMLFTLNPYEYATWSPMLTDLATKYRNKSILMS